METKGKGARDWLQKHVGTARAWIFPEPCFISSQYFLALGETAVSFSSEELICFALQAWKKKTRVRLLTWNILEHTYSTPTAYKGLNLTVLKLRNVSGAETDRGHWKTRLEEEKGNRFELQECISVSVH